MKSFFIACLTMTIAAGIANASLIVGNSVTPAYQNNGTSFGNKYVGFTIGSTSVSLDSIDVALGAFGLSGGSVTFVLAADGGSFSPGALIGQIGSQTIESAAPTINYHLAPVNQIILPAAATFWIGVDLNGGSVRWDQTTSALAPSNGLATYVGYNLNGSNSSILNAITVNGTASSAPEPGTYGLLALALGLILAADRMRAR